MAKAGPASRITTEGTDRSSSTRIALVHATIETLKESGFAGASARAIAERATLNQGLVFYHFGSVANLLLAALDAVSADRMHKYRTAVQDVTSPLDLMAVATKVFQEDLDAGYVTVLVEMIAGANSTPGLGVEVASRIEPWFAFAREALDENFGTSPLATLLPSSDVAFAVVALYLGLEMLTHLDGNRAPAMNLFAHAQRLTTLLDAFSSPGSLGLMS